MADGRVREFASTIDAKTLAAATSPRGGEIVALSDFSTQPPVGPTVTPPPNDALDPIKSQMKRIGLAMHSYHDKHQRFPVADNPMYFDANGRPFLSWRVHLLPFLEQESLYQEFHLNEPWDSPHNATLIARMPPVYYNNSLQGSKTPFVVFTGANTPFSQKLGPSIASFTDGTSRTLLVTDVADDKMMTWTQPVDINFDPNSPLAEVGLIPPTGLPVLLADGSFSRLKPFIPWDMFNTMVTPAGNEVDDTSSMVVR